MQVLNNISFYCHSSTAKSIDSIHTQKPWKPSLTTFPTDRLDVDGTRTQFLLKVKVNSLSRVQLVVTLWTVAHQAALSMGFSRQKYWSGLPFPTPGDLPNPGIKAGPLTLQADYHLSHQENLRNDIRCWEISRRGKSTGLLSHCPKKIS